jgi:hypothetical protein
MMKLQIPKVGLVIALSMCALVGCTSREWYESANATARNECNRMQPGAREECLAKVNKTPYDDYEKERTRNKP